MPSSRPRCSGARWWPPCSSRPCCCCFVTGAAAWRCGPQPATRARRTRWASTCPGCFRWPGCIPEIKLNNFPVHSRYIREFLLNGDIEKANSFLGKEYKIFGKHIVGQGLGKKEFVATINLNVNEFLLPQSGVYITKTIVNDIEYNSVSFLGHRGSTDGKFAVETHILNQENIEIKDENVQIKFIRRIRENRKFDNFLELKNQILKDIDIAKKYFY